jgi:SAM-dependent methyltransferase
VWLGDESGAGNPNNTQPNAFLVEMVKGRKRGLALDVAMGQGRNTLWLAQQGWDVTGFDIADQAVAAANREAGRLGLKIRAEVKSTDQFDFGENRWDLILLCYAGGRQMVDRVERSLKPGGILIVEAFHDDALRTFRIGGSLFRTGELPHIFQGLRTVYYAEPIAQPDFAPAPVRVVRFCAQKPDSH